MKRSLGILLSSILFTATAATEPPDVMNYQGVLRDAADNPLAGDHDMVFRFWSAATGGDEILIDRHTTLDSSPVTVSDGLFDVELGGGLVQDGSGPDSNGPYTTLHKVFKNYSTVWLEIEIGGEVLSPRVRVRSAAYAFNSMHLGGIRWNQYLNDTTNEQHKLGRLLLGQTTAVGFGEGLEVFGTAGGAAAYFEDLNDGGKAFLAYGAQGIQARGTNVGGKFSDDDSSGYAEIASGDNGVWAIGDLAGGHFEDRDGLDFADVATNGYGIRANGSVAGGYFADLDSTGTAYLGQGDSGIDARGNSFGGYFKDRNDTGDAFVGQGHFGLNARGQWQAFRTGGGGRFEDTLYSGLAYAAHGNTGIYAEGTFAGGEFKDTDSGNYGRVGYSTYKVFGTGSVSFVQNHPEDPGKVIVYHAPEASEVSVYTRGSARLVDGTVRVPLDPTFRWTANPDLGLTAHLTPRGAAPDLHVVSVSTEELVVAGTTDVEFDYMVWGLRVGFEESAPVQDKLEDAPIPSMASHRDLYAKQTGLRRFNALERFRAIEGERRGVDAESLDLSRAEGLVARIGEHDPAAKNSRGRISIATPHGEASHDEGAPTPAGGGGPAGAAVAFSEASVVSLAEASAEDESAIVAATWFPVRAPVEAGDLLALDPDGTGRLDRAATLADPGVVGIAVGAARTTASGGLEAPVADGRYATVKADAGFGEIRPGDWLVTSPNPGHAMRAVDDVPGTIVGKALETLATGTGTIRVLISPR